MDTIFQYETEFDKQGPYASVARFLERPTIRTSKMGFPYMTGYSQALECETSVHYRRRNLKTMRDPGFVVHWPFGRQAEKQERRILSSLDEVEQLVRPFSVDLSWVGSLKDEAKSLVHKLLSSVLYKTQCEFEDFEKVLMSRLTALVDPNEPVHSANQYMIPPNQRHVLHQVFRQLHVADVHLTEVLKAEEVEFIGKVITSLPDMSSGAFRPA